MNNFSIAGFFKDKCFSRSMSAPQCHFPHVPEIVGAKHEFPPLGFLPFYRKSASTPYAARHSPRRGFKYINRGIRLSRYGTACFSIFLFFNLFCFCCFPYIFPSFFFLSTHLFSNQEASVFIHSLLSILCTNQ